MCLFATYCSIDSLQFGQEDIALSIGQSIHRDKNLEIRRKDRWNSAAGGVAASQHL